MRFSLRIIGTLALAGFLCIAFGAHGKAYAAPGDLLWDAAYSSRPDSDNDRASGLAIDGQGNLLVSGSRANRDGNYDYLTVKYGPYGSTIWVGMFDNSWYDVGRAVAAGPEGGAIVAGVSFNLDNPRDTYSNSFYTDYRIVKYDPAGTPVAEMAASGFRKNNDPASVAVDKDGGIYVTGSAKDGSDLYPMYYTVKFGPEGTLLWERPEDWGAESYAAGLKLDKDGSVVVTGWTMNPLNGTYDIRTLRYSADGARLLMDVPYNDLYYDEKAHGLAIDGEGNIIITGETSADGGAVLTLKYSPTGRLLWATRYRESEYSSAGASAAADRYGRIYAAGTTVKDDQKGDYLLLVYGKDGGLLGARTYDFGGDDGAEAVALDAYGNIVMAGTTRMPDKPGVFRTIRVEGYPPPADYGAGFSTDYIFTGARKITLSRPPAPMVRRVVLTAQKSGPGDGKSPLKFVADPIGFTTEYEYRFFVMGRNTAHHWEAVSDYSDRNYWVLKPSEGPANPAKVMVQVRTKGSRLVYEAQAAMDLDSIHPGN